MFGKIITELRTVTPAVALVVFVAMLAVSQTACAPQKTKAPERASADEPYEFEKEGTIPPPDEKLDRGEADVEEMPMEDDNITSENVEAPKDTTGKATGPPGGPAGVAGKDGAIAIPVYRVQILATSSEKSALDAKKKAEGRLGFPAYVSFVDGMYKVRVGDCNNRQVAEKVRTKCRQAGYTDAWIVTDAFKVSPDTGDQSD